MKIGKLDKRHNGHKNFKYHVRFYTINRDKFVDVRNWCWKTWGPSAELETLDLLQKYTDHKWSWVCDKYTTKIFLRSDDEYQWFLLKWK